MFSLRKVMFELCHGYFCNKLARIVTEALLLTKLLSVVKSL